MNILFFNRSFYPDIEATGQLMAELCEDLVSYGHKVTVIAGRPTYVLEEKSIYFLKNDKYKEIDVIRVGGTRLPKRNLFFRLVNLGFYFLYSFIAGFKIKNKPDVVIALTDPPLICLVGLFFAIIYRAKFIYYCNDIYPDVAIVTQRFNYSIAHFILKIANETAFKNANKIICIGESMKERIIEKGFNSRKIEVVHNWADTSQMYPVKKEENEFIKENNLTNKFIIMYSGNIGLTQELEKILHVAKEFESKKDIVFLFIGEGAEKNKLLNIKNKETITNIEFLPYEPKEKLKYSLSAAAVHLIPFLKGLKGILVPSKIYGILACGKPFIAWVEEGTEIFEIAHKYKCGITAEPGSVKNMVRAITWAYDHKNLLDEMGQRGLDVARKYFDRKISTGKFDEIIKGL